MNLSDISLPVIILNIILSIIFIISHSISLNIIRKLTKYYKKTDINEYEILNKNDIRKLGMDEIFIIFILIFSVLCLLLNIYLLINKIKD